MAVVVKEGLKIVKKEEDYKPSAVQVACTTEAIMGIVKFRKPFYGLLYAKDYFEDSCTARGNGSREIHLVIPTNECGSISVKNTEGKQEFQVSLYLQHDKKLQQVYDEMLHLRCVPATVTVVMVKMNQEGSNNSAEFTDHSKDSSYLPILSRSLEHSVFSAEKPNENLLKNSGSNNESSLTQNPAVWKRSYPDFVNDFNSTLKSEERPSHINQLSSSKLSFRILSKKMPHSEFLKSLQRPLIEHSFVVLESDIDPDMKMIVMRGEMEELENSDNPSEIVDTVTLKILYKNPKNIQTKIADCNAFDETGRKYELLDSNGCIANETFLSNLTETYDSETSTQAAFVTLNATAFPEMQRLNISCHQLSCDKQCNRDYMSQKEETTEKSYQHFGKGNFRMNKQIFQRNSHAEPESHAELDLHKKHFKETFHDGTAHSENLKKGIVKENVSHSKLAPHSTTSDFQGAELMTSDAGIENCLNSTRIILIVSILLSFLIISLVVTICTCVRSRELNRRLMQRRMIPFLKIPQYSP
nr:uncharacterized protein LOC122271332 [Parasteatoda tepidariorum]